MIDYTPLPRKTGTRKEHDGIVRSICRECAVGCALLAYVKGNGVVDVHGDDAHPVSRGRLCARGTAFVQGLKHPDRILFPGLRQRRPGPLEAVNNLDAGLDALAEQLRKIKDRHGPESLYIGCDPEAGLDFYLGAMRFARLWGTPHVYHPLEEPAPNGGEPLIFGPAMTCRDWPSAGALFLVEADLAATHPVAFGWVRQAQKQGVKIVAADARRTATLSKADLSLVIRPETGNRLGAALMKLFMDEGRLDDGAVSAGFHDPDAWMAAFNAFSASDAAALAGTAETEVTELARCLCENGPAAVITGKRLAYQPGYGIWQTMACAMGWVKFNGCGWRPLEAGRPPLDAAADIDPPETLRETERTGPYPYQAKRRPDLSPAESNVKAVIGSGNCFNNFFVPFRDLVHKMDFIVHFGAFPNFTSGVSHMVFPAALWPERSGLCFSDDCAVQWGEKIVEPDSACLTGLDFWRGLAERFGWEAYFPWTSDAGRADHAAFYDWLMARTPALEGFTVQDLKDAGSDLRRWPANAKMRQRREAPFFPTASGKITPFAPADRPDEAPADAAAFPLFFQSARLAFRSGDASHWWPWIAELTAENAVHIHPDVAGALHISNGEEVQISGAAATLRGRARISRAVPRRMIWAPQRLGEMRVCLRKKGQTRQEALDLLTDYFNQAEKTG